MSAEEVGLLQDGDSGRSGGGSSRFFRGGSSSGTTGVSGGLNMIALEVVSCRGIVAGDKGNTSDAFVTLKLEKAGKFKNPKQTSKTNVRGDTNGLDPVFNWKLKLRATESTGVLKIEVRDEDKRMGGLGTTSELLGKVDVPIAPLLEMHHSQVGLPEFEGKPDEVGLYEQTIELNNKKGKADGKSGSIFLRWRWYKAHADESSDEDSVDEGDGEDAGDEDDDGKDGNEQEKKTEEEVAAEKEAAAQAEKDAEEELASIDIKAGDYQVQVHIIEVRDLRPKDANGLSDPIVHVDSMGKKANTGVKKQTLSAAFDEVFVLDHPKLEKEDVETGLITIRVMDADLLSKSDLIGGYTFDTSYVYAQKNHELHRKWFGLFDLDNPADSRAQGYLKCSIVVIGPGDKQAKHDEAEDMKKERKEEAGGDISKLVTMPSNVKRELKYLVVCVFKAEDLPVMDSAGLTSKGGIDAFVEVQFCGNKKRTKVRKKKGTDRKRLRPKFNEQIWLPCIVPTMSKNITLSVWDHDIVGSNDKVATTYMNFKRDVPTDGSRSVPKWFNLYGCPHAAFDKSNEAKDMMLTYPDRGSSYRGRLLLSAKLVTQEMAEAMEAENKTKTKGFPGPHSRKCFKAERPEIFQYKFKALVMTGSEMPENLGGLLKGKAEIGVRVSCGLYNLDFAKTKNQGGVCTWKQELSCDVEGGVRLPADLDQVPDIFVYAHKGISAKGDYEPFAFQRFSARQWMEAECGGFGHPCKWMMLQEDDSLDMLSDFDLPGNLLLRVGFGSETMEREQARSWAEDVGAMSDNDMFHVRVHIFQGRGLPAADSNGLLDPYLKVKFGVLANGDKPKETARRQKTCNPQWYQTIEFASTIPKRLEFAPQVSMQLFDEDKGIGEKDDYCGSFFLALGDAVSSATDPKYAGVVLEQQGASGEWSAEVPRPVWKQLSLQKPGDSEGEVLVSVQIFQQSPGMSKAPPAIEKPDLMTKENPKGVKEVDIVNPALVPKTMDAWVEITALGLRSLAAYKFVPIQNAFCEFSVDTPNAAAPVATKASKRPSGQNPNFLERIVLKLQLPEDALFAPRLTLTARDTRLGGYQKPTIGTASIDLSNKLPWCSDSYEPPVALMSRKQQRKMTRHSKVGRKMTANPPPTQRVSAQQVQHPSGAEESEFSDDSSDADEDESKDGRSRGASSMGVGSKYMPKQGTDSGAGVFGALLDYDSEEDVPTGVGVGHDGRKGTVVMPPGMEEWVEEDDDPPKYMFFTQGDKREGTQTHSQRDELTGEMEEVIDSPFETYGIFLGQKFGNSGGWGKKKASSSYRQTGKFKGVVRVIAWRKEHSGVFNADGEELPDNPEARIEPLINGKENDQYEPMFDMAQLMQPQPYQVRVYFLLGEKFKPMDMAVGGRPGKSDPYLKLKLGKKKINDRKNYIDDTTDPAFFKSFTMEARLPGASTLSIKAMDYDLIGSDDLIGETTIDLEDRLFSKRWREWGANLQNEGEVDKEGVVLSEPRFAPKPVEFRGLYTPASGTANGTIKMWVDILTAKEAAMFPPDDVSLPPDAKFQVQFIVWKTKDVPAMDTMTDMNDMFAKVWIEGTKPHTTDVHWRCKKGKGSFNYRMKIPITLGFRTKTMKFPFLHLQVSSAGACCHRAAILVRYDADSADDDAHLQSFSLSLSLYSSSSAPRC